jgi:biopolymer transport protein ExbD
MVKRHASIFEQLRALTMLPFICGIVLANACAQQPSPAPLSSAPPSPQSAAVKIKLNGEDVGTTADTSALVKRFTEILDQRRATFSNGTVFIRAENSARFSEVARVVEALRKNHGLLYLAIEVDPANDGSISADPVIIGSSVDSGDVYINKFPRSMMLVVTVGDLGSTRGELISGGMDLLPTPYTMRFAARHSVPKEFVVVEAFRDNEYVIEDKPTPSSALRSELQDRVSKTADKRVMILTRGDSEIRWATFMEVANAARAAGAGMIQLLRLTP